MNLLALVAAAALCAAPPTSELLTPRFRIVHTEAAQGGARVLAEQIEGLRTHMVSVLGRDWDGTTEIRLGLGRDELDALSLAGPVPSWAEALAWPDANVVLVDARTLTKSDGHVTLRHELLHVALGRMGKDWPRWFHEGLAQVLNGERRYSFDHYTTLAGAVKRDRVFRFDDLAVRFPDRPDDVQVAYAQSAAFVAFLLERHAPAQLGALFEATSTGLGFELAFARAFKTTVTLEERAFVAELPSRYPLWPIITLGSTLWALAAGLVIVGYGVRRRRVLARRAEEAAREVAEDAARRILAAEQARLLGPLAPPPEPEPWETPPDGERPAQDGSPPAADGAAAATGKPTLH